MSDNIPSEPGSITADWLTDVLRGDRTIRRASVASFEAQRIGQGRGFIGRVLRILLHYDVEEPRSPPTLIVKLSPADPELRDRVFELYEREIRFYTRLAPKVELRTPHLYHGSSDARTADAVLVLEDLSDFRRGEHVSGCSLERARLVVSQLARLHARWSRPQWRRKLSWLPDLSEDLEPEADAAFLQKVFALCVERCGEKFPPRALELAHRFAGSASRLRTMLATSPNTLVHGDLRLDNILFASKRSLAGPALIDWQLARRAPGVIDVAYFIGLNLDTTTRRRVEIGLLKAYHSALSKNVKGYGFERCLRDFRIAIVFMFFRLMTAAALLDFTSKRAQACLDSWIRRGALMMDDHDVGAFLEQRAE